MSVKVNTTSAGFIGIADMTIGQGGYSVSGMPIGHVLLRVKGNYVIDLTSGDIISTSAEVTVFVFPTNTEIVIGTL